MKSVLLAVAIVLLLGTLASAEMFTATLPWPEAGEEVDLMQLQAEVLKKVPSLEPVLVGFSSSSKSLCIITRDRELTKAERRKVNKAALIHMPDEPEPRKTLMEWIAELDNTLALISKRATAIEELSAQMIERVAELDNTLARIDMDKLLNIIEVYGD